MEVVSPVSLAVSAAETFACTVACIASMSPTASHTAALSFPLRPALFFDTFAIVFEWLNSHHICQSQLHEAAKE